MLSELKDSKILLCVSPVFGGKLCRHFNVRLAGRKLKLTKRFVIVRILMLVMSRRILLAVVSLC
jgi:hypothetical protein